MAGIVDNIVYGGPVEGDFTEGTKSLGEYCYKNLIRNGDTVLVLNGITEEKTTAAEIVARSIRMAQALLAIGIKEGDKIGICSENRVEFCYVGFGALFIGAALATVSLSVTEGEMHHMVNLSKPTIIFASEKSVERVVNVAKRNPYITDVYQFGPKLKTKKAKLFNDFINNPDIPTVSEWVCKPQDIADRTAIVVCSSGTTGLSKGIELTQLNLMAYLHHDTLKQEGNMLCDAPFSSSFGFTTMMIMAFNSTTVVIWPTFDDHSFLECIQKYKIRDLHVAPPVMFVIAKSPEVDNYDLSSIQHIFCAGTAIANNTIYDVRKRIGVKYILETYGLSECLGLLFQDEEHRTVGSLGVLLPGIYGKVIDMQTGELLGPNRHGELWFKSMSIMKGYIGNEEATRNTIDKDGYLHTGDIGYYDESAEWFFVERYKELIKYKIYHVPPAELESLLMSHPNVVDACVVGLPDDACGELPLAFIVRDGDVTDDDLIDFVADRVSSHKHLRGGVRFVDSIPKNPAGKSLRRLLKNSLKT